MLKDLDTKTLGFINSYITKINDLNNDHYKSLTQTEGLHKRFNRKWDKKYPLINKEPSISKKKEIYKFYLKIFNSSFDKTKKEVLLSTAFGYEMWSWRVVGISFKALAEFENNKFKYVTRKFNRDHFDQPRNITFKKMLENIMDYDEWWNFFWENDQTVILTLDQHSRVDNRKKNQLDRLVYNIVPIDWRLGYFVANPRLGFRYTLGREGEYLKRLSRIFYDK